MIKNISLLLVMFFLSLAVKAQEAKIIEVQEKIKIDASAFLQKFAPGSKFSVKVKIKPLRRSSKVNSQAEDLPFMGFQEDLVQDEWEDPNSNIYSLYSRISEAKIRIYIEDKVKIEDRLKFKEALLSDVNLIPGRDSVEIENIVSPIFTRSFDIGEQEQTILLGGMILFAIVFGVGLNAYFRKKSSFQKTRENETKINQSPAPSAFSSSMGNSQNIMVHDNSRLSSNSVNGDLNIQDPSKINEVVGQKIQKLITSNNFPNLSDMVILEQLLENDPASFSYLVYEFPQDVQKDIYQLGKGERWFKGFSDVGFPSKVVLMSLDQMLRNRDIHQSADFERLLIFCWRLVRNQTSFFKQLSNEKAFSILFYLPKDISIPIARECYPGSWGVLLENKLKYEMLSNSEIHELQKKALSLQPLFNYDSLQVFKNRKDLLKYLDDVEPQEEKDIYNVMGDYSDLVNIRPPFFKVFELDHEKRDEVFRKFSLNEWVIACFNIDRQEKDLITDLMDEKEKYLFSHMLKELDTNPNLVQNKLDIRKKIALHVKEMFYDDEKTNIVNLKENDIDKDGYSAA